MGPDNRSKLRLSAISLHISDILTLLKDSDNTVLQSGICWLLESGVIKEVDNKSDIGLDNTDQA